MAKYTIELRQIIEDSSYDIFGFPYEFISEDLKGIFEDRFKQHFYFHEIGFETVSRFQQRLRANLNRIAPYYKQLYETELKSRKLDFMLNKDLKETTIRELLSENDKIQDMSNNQIGNSETNSNSNTNNNEKSGSITNNKESNLNNGIANLGQNDGYLTSVNKEEIDSNLNSDTTQKTTSIDSNKIESTNSLSENEKKKDYEAITLLSQGNIGVTSSAELLEKWRNVLINIFEMYFEELEHLFILFM